MAYFGTQTNNVKKNSGLYTPSQILELTKDGSWGGSLELIETETFSGASSVNFDDLGNYKVHVFQWNNIHLDDNRDMNLRTKVGGSVQSASSTYSRAMQVGSSSQDQDKDPNLDRLRLWAQTGADTGEAVNGFLWMYCALDSTKYTTFNQHYAQIIYNGNFEGSFGGGAYKVANTLSGVQLYPSSSTITGSISLYGLKEAV
tara:strand:+ start:519 stop:1121 length:603 start_codon:yes stop_codon:yes gene_type:complete